MAKKGLTARDFETLTAGSTGRAHLTDSEVPGLTLCVTAKGARTWSFLTRVNGEKRRFNIGDYGDKAGQFGLKAAREEALRLRALAREGRDPTRERQEARRKAEIEKVTRVTVSDALDSYSALYLRPNLRTAAERERQIRSALTPHLSRPIGELTRVDLQKAIDAKAAEGKLGAANRIRAALVHFSRWCFERGHLPEHVGAGTARAAKERPRERVLSIEEIRHIYASTATLGPIWGPLYRLRLLTAQRLGDIAQARWSEIDFDARRYEIPGSRTKNGRAHVVHLSEPVLVELRALKERTGGTPFVFTTTGKAPVSGFSKANRALYEASGVQDFRPHDFRTAFASALCEAGESETVVDRILNHSASGSAPSAVARVYNRAQNLPQRAAALDRWAQMVTDERGVVVELSR